MTTPGDPKGTRFDPAMHRPSRELTPSDVTPSDLRHGLDELRTEAARGRASAAAVLLEIERLRGMLGLIPRGAVSKHGTHRWTGRNWIER